MKISIPVEDDLVGTISDGYHTFNELYDHRITLYIALCKSLLRTNSLPPAISTTTYEVWKSQTHSDGSKWDGWFILGINTTPGEQISYHLPESYWEKCVFATTFDKAPEFDGHTPADVLERIAVL